MTTMSRYEAAFSGIASGFTLLILSYFLAGAGHGWPSPLLVSIFSLPVLPFVLANYYSPNPSRRVAITLIVLTVILDCILLFTTWGYGIELFKASYQFSPWLIYAFISLWLLWQPLPVINLLRLRRA